MQSLCKLHTNRFITMHSELEQRDMADFTSKHNLKASLHFSSRSQYTNLATHGNEQLDTKILESQKQNQNP